MTLDLANIIHVHKNNGIICFYSVWEIFLLFNFWDFLWNATAVNLQAATAIIGKTLNLTMGMENVGMGKCGACYG